MKWTSTQAMTDQYRRYRNSERLEQRAEKKADGEADVLAKIAALPGPDRAMGERLHAIIKASAPGLSPKLWYGMPA